MTLLCQFDYGNVIFNGNIIKQLALIIVNGATAYGSFVNELNARIDAYNQMLALRKGKKDAKDDKQVDK